MRFELFLQNVWLMQGEVLNIISIQDNCWKFSPSEVFNSPRAGFEHEQNFSLGFVELNFVVVVTTTSPR